MPRRGITHLSLITVWFLLTVQMTHLQSVAGAGAPPCATISGPTQAMTNTTIGFVATFPSCNIATLAVDFGDGSVLLNSANLTSITQTLSVMHNYVTYTPPVYTYQIKAHAYCQDVKCDIKITQTLTFFEKVNMSVSYPPVGIDLEETHFVMTPLTGTNVTRCIGYGDVVNETVRCGDYKSFVHTYTLPAQSLPLVLTADNVVSAWSVPSCTITIEPMLKPFDCTWNDTILWLPGYGEWTVMLGSNIFNLTDLRCNWTIGGLGTDILKTAFHSVPLMTPWQGDVMSYYFEKADVGEHEISVNCSNDISSQLCSKTVEVALDDVKITSFVVKPVFWNDSSIFVIKILRYGTGGCIELDLGDEIVYLFSPVVCTSYTYAIPLGCSCNGYRDKPPTHFFQIVPGKQTLMINYTYEDIGRYQASVRGFNYADNVTLSQIVKVKAWACFPANITVNSTYLDASVIPEMRWSQNATIFADVEPDCKYMQWLTITWQVYLTQDLEVNPSPTALVTVPNSDTFYYTGRMLPYGEYTFRVTVRLFSSYRNLSNYTCSLDGYVNIREPIPVLQLNGSESLLWRPGEGNWTVSLEDPADWLENVSCSWTFGGSVTPVDVFIPVLTSSSSNTQMQTYSRTDCGKQKVTVNCSNSFSSQYYAMDVDVILDSVNVSSLVYNGTYYWNTTLTFSLNITRFGTRACFEFDMGDGTPHVIYQGPSGCIDNNNALLNSVLIEPTTQIINLYYLYAEFGIYTVSVRYYNLVNDDSITLIANVSDWPCSVPSVEIDNVYLNETQPVVVRVPEGLTLNVNHSVDCMKMQVTTTTWQVFSISALKTLGSFAPVLFNATNNDTLILKPFTLPYGLLLARYSVKMRSNHFNLTSYDTEITAYLNVTPNDLVVGVAGGPYLSLTFNQEHTFDALNSTYDPDVPDRTNKAGMNFTWLCKRFEESWPSSVLNSAPITAHLFKGENGGCYGDGPGVVSESSVAYSLKIDPNLFIPRLNYTLRLVVEKDTRTTTYDVTFFVPPSPPPVLSRQLVILSVTTFCLSYFIRI